MSNDSLGNRIKQLRGAVSQAEFAKKYGLSKNTLWGYENGTSEPKASFVVRLVADFGITSDWLLFGGEAPPKPKLTSQEAALLDNYRHCPESAQRNLEQTSALLAQRGGCKKLKDAG